jgi:ferrous iron transport protein A
MNLSQIKINTNAVILSLSSFKCDRLREMGFCEKAKIKKIKDGRLLICDICNCKIALSKDLAEGIEVKIVD